MESQNQKAGAADSQDKSGEGGRSSIRFPYADLDNAIEVVRGVHEVGGTGCTYEQLAAHLGAEAKGGGFRLRINATEVYGLIDYERGGRITITDLGHRIIDPQKERAARRDAFMQVELFQKVFEAFNGRPLPPQAGLERTMVQFGVGAKVADRARQVMLRSAKQAGYFDLAPDRLTMPPIREEGQQEQKKDEQVKEKKNGGSDGGGPDHPLIQGLLQTLPQPNSPWSSRERFNWLTMANSIFKIIYQSQDQGDVKIEHTQPEKGGATVEELV